MRLVDGVTGWVLDERVHKSARGPIAVTMAEHWVVYSYWNVAAEQVEVAVLELYEASVPDERQASTTFSSYDRMRPAILAQAYVFPTQPLALAVTQTRHGITSRHVLGL